MRLVAACFLGMFRFPLVKPGLELFGDPFVRLGFCREALDLFGLAIWPFRSHEPLAIFCTAHLHDRDLIHG